jgi:hypothetical protein
MLSIFCTIYTNSYTAVVLLATVAPEGVDYYVLPSQWTQNLLAVEENPLVKRQEVLR